MVNVGKLPNEVLEKILVHVVAGAEKKYSEMDKLTKVSNKWSDIIHGAVIPLKKALTMTVHWYYWTTDDLSTEVALMKKYNQFKTAQSLHLRIRDELDYYKGYISFVEQSSQSTIIIEDSLYEFYYEQVKLLHKVMKLFKNSEFVFVIDGFDLSGTSSFDELTALATLKASKVQIQIDEWCIENLLDEEKRTQIEVTNYRAETVELVNIENYCVHDLCTAEKAGNIYSFSKSETRGKEILQFLEENFMDEAERQEEERQEEEKLNFNQESYDEMIQFVRDSIGHFF